MWNKPTPKQLALIPDLYSQEHVKDKKVYIKFFLGSWTWYILEFDKKDTFFAFVVSPMEPEGGFGYVSYRELLNMRISYAEVDRELHQVNPREPKKLSVILTEDRIPSKFASKPEFNPEARRQIVDNALQQKQSAKRSFEYIGRQMMSKESSRRKIPVKQVRLLRAEGITDLKWRIFPSLADANAQVRKNALTAPKSGGYDKHDFQIIWEDGKTYEGRLDVKHPSQLGNDNDIGAHVRKFLEYMASNPKSSATPAQRKEAQVYLDRYELR